MPTRPHVAIVNSYDRAGGAEAVARALVRGLPDEGFTVSFLVGRRRGGDEAALQITGAFGRGPAGGFEAAKRNLMRLRGGWRLVKLIRDLMRPRVTLDRWLGREPFYFPDSRRLLDVAPRRPDLVHLHNLHGEYFDLRTLPELGARVPVLVTLHDRWLLTGHCGSSLDCERWKTGCGRCPYLDLHPAVSRDATRANWRRKQRIYRRCRLYLAAPSRAAMEQARQSMLWPAVIDSRVIPNGVDVDVFRPGDRGSARAALGIAGDDVVLLCVGQSLRVNRFKHYETAVAAARTVAASLPGRRVVLIGVGDDGPGGEERLGDARLRHVPFEHDPKRLAEHYRAADLLLHPALSEAWGLVVTEAMACATPVIATAVEALPEQVLGLGVPGSVGAAVHAERATGALVPPRDSDAMAAAVLELLRSPTLLRRLGDQAAAHVRANFTQKRQTAAYAAFYHEILSRGR